MRDPHPVEPLASPPDVDIALPGSKSITNRALIISALAEGVTELEGVLFADDTWAMIEALRSLGVGIDTNEAESTATVDGCGGRLPAVAATLDARQSGTTSRFLIPVVALGSTPVVVDGADQLRLRPMDDQISALRELGVSVKELASPGRLPVCVTGPLGRCQVRVAAAASSQFASGLLLAGAVRGMQLSLTGAPVSLPYIEMTIGVMEAFGATAESADNHSWRVGGGYRSPGSYQIEPDASAAAYFMAAAAITGGRVRIHGLGGESVQGDVAFAEVLAEMGAHVEVGTDQIEVSGGELHGIEVDLSNISDTAPTLAVVAAFASGPTVVSGIGFIRGKESDRIAGTVAELNRCGVMATETPDGFVVRPSGRPGPATIDTYDDHRMAMAFALIGLVVEGIAIKGPGCVAKTFPDFFSTLDQLR